MRKGAASLAAKHPDIAAEWHPTANGDLTPDRVSASSAEKVTWLCPEGHDYPATVRNRTYAKSKCPVCRGRSIRAGVNDIATTHPELARQWHEDNVVSPTEVGYRSETVVVKWRCPVEGYVWEATPASRAYYGTSMKCPVCRGQEVMLGVNDIFTAVPEWREQWHPDNTVDPATLTSHSGVVVQWKCPVDGHEWATSPSQRWNKGKPSQCSVCVGSRRKVGVNDLLTTHPHLAAELADTSLGTVLGAGSGETDWVCRNGHTWRASVNDRTARGYGCTRCSGKVVTAGVNDLETLRPDMASQWGAANDKSPSEVALYTNYQAEWVCDKDPSHTWRTAVGNRTRAGSGCPLCSARLRTSKGEREVAAFVESLVGRDSVERNARGVLRGSRAELDVWVPQLHIAVEFNGTYYHSTAHNSDPKRHWRKREACLAQGITLIQVWEDTWNLRRDAVESMLAVKLGVYGGERVYARNTSAEMSDNESVRKFLNAHHMQGAVDGSWVVALKSNDETVAVLVAKHAGGDTADITRYATSCSVVGGFSKALAALDRVLPSHISRLVSFADKEISYGNLYHASGFVADADIAPDYRYLPYGKSVREHKFNYRKGRFKSDPSLEYVDGMSERELAELNGMHRCYDSGKIRFVRER